MSNPFMSARSRAGCFRKLTSCYHPFKSGYFFKVLNGDHPRGLVHFLFKKKEPTRFKKKTITPGCAVVSRLGR